MKRLISILALAALPLYANEPQTESVRGTVLYSQAWQFFLLKTEARVVRVQTRQGDPALSPGDVVEARGVPARRNGRITVEAATYEKTGENGVVPETQSIGPKDLPRVFDEGKPSDLYGMPVRLKASVLNVVQESVTNAIKHGKATRILIASDARGPKKVELRIVNNGTPFDTSHALGPEAGHFGLSGMRERARRNGFAISFASKRHTTSVRLEIKT